MDDRALWEGFAVKTRLHSTLCTGPTVQVTGISEAIPWQLSGCRGRYTETFAGIWQHPNGFDPERGTLRSYVFCAGRKRAAECRWLEEELAG